MLVVWLLVWTPLCRTPSAGPPKISLFFPLPPQFLFFSPCCPPLQGAVAKNVLRPMFCVRSATNTGYTTRLSGGEPQPSPITAPLVLSVCFHADDTRATVTTIFLPETARPTWTTSPVFDCLRRYGTLEFRKLLSNFHPSHNSPCLALRRH